MAARLTKQPLLEINQDEALSLASALKDVAALHSINVSPSTIAYVKLVGALAVVYGPRVGIITAASKMKKQQAQGTFDAATGHPVS